jgi:tetratricopeptide (TPR) repeat protein
MLAVKLPHPNEFNSKIRKLKKILKFDPNNEAALSKLSFSYLYQGKILDATLLLEKLVKINPKNKAVYRILGINYFQMNRFDEAISNLENSLTQTPDDGAILLDIAACYVNKLDYSNAYPYLKKLLNYDKCLLQIHDLLCVVCSKLDKNEEAIEHANLALDLGGKETTDVLTNAAYAYIRANRVEEGIELLKLGMKIGFDPRLYVLLAEIYIDTFQTEAAKPVIDSLLINQPHDYRTYFLHGQYLEQKNDYQGSVDAYKKALAINPQFVDDWGYLTVAQLNAGTTTEALATLKKWLDLDPSNEDALKLEKVLNPTDVTVN